MEVSEGTALLNPDGSLTLYRDDLQEKWDYP
jgi:hypothetical protein